MLWTPKNQNPPPVNSMPIYMDVNLTVGGSNTFDVPPGQVGEGARVILPVAAGCSVSAGTCTTTGCGCGWRTRRPARC